MASPARIPLGQLNEMTEPEFVAGLGDIFENAPWLAEAVAPSRPFATIGALHQAMLSQLAAMPRDAVTAFLNNHPELAGPGARVAPLGEHSAREQTGAGLDQLTDQDTDRLAGLNATYRARFGFPFIICALRHGKDSIFTEFERRLTVAPDPERQAALAEIARISALRLAHRIEGPGIPQVHGELSTHLLDTARGCPAAAVPIELHLLSKDGGSALVAAATSEVDGRTPTPLITGRPVPNGTYELRFRLGGYLAGEGFIDVVPVRFTTAEPEGHYHIPLLFTPWSYSTYRGS